MNTSKRGLGKGLDALLATSAKAHIITSDTSPSSRFDEKLYSLPIAALTHGKYQPRKVMEQAALEELAESIQAQGVIQPLVVRELDRDSFEIIAGERRYRAAQLAGLSHLPCVVRQFDDKTAGAVALIENIQREDLNTMEEAEALQRLVNDFALTHQQLADFIGKSRATITNLLRLNSLDIGVKTLMKEGQIEMGHARALLGLEIKDQLNVALTVVNKKLTVRQTEALVKKLLTPLNESVTPPPISPYHDLQEKLSNKLGTPVTLFKGKGNSGKLVINFDQSEKLMQILAIFDEKL